METHEEKELVTARKNSLLLMVFTLLSRILGIIKARVIATIFGLTEIGDVINFTFNIPNNFRKLFAEGALNSAFIPIFTRLIVEKRGQKELLRNLFGFQLVIMIPIILLTFLFRYPIVTFLSDFSTPEAIHLGGNLLSYFTIYLALISLYALLAGVLQSHQTFLVASIAPLIFSVSVIISVIVLSPSLQAYSMVVGVIVGGVGQVLFTLAKVKSLHYDTKITFHFRNPHMVSVLRRWAPVTISSVIAITTQQIAYYFASTLPSGSVSAFSNAIIVWQAPYGIFYAAIATSFFPALSIAYNKQNFSQIKKISTEGISYLASLLIPSTILLIFWRNESCAVLFSGGAFSITDAIRTGNVLLFFAIGMPFAAIYGFLQRLSYSVNMFKTTVYVALAVSVIDVIATILLLIKSTDVSSVALANSIALTSGLLIYIVVLAKNKIFIFTNRILMKKLGMIILTNIPLVLILLLVKRTLDPSWWLQGSSLSSFLILALIYCASGVLMIGVYRLAHIDIGIFFKKKSVK